MAGTKNQKITILIGVQEVKITSMKDSTFDVQVGEILLGSVSYTTVKGKVKWFSKTGMRAELVKDIGVKISEQIFPCKHKRKRYKIDAKIAL